MFPNNFTCSTKIKCRTATGHKKSKCFTLLLLQKSALNVFKPKESVFKHTKFSLSTLLAFFSQHPAADLPPSSPCPMPSGSSRVYPLPRQAPCLRQPRTKPPVPVNSCIRALCKLSPVTKSLQKKTQKSHELWLGSKGRTAARVGCPGRSPSLQKGASANCQPALLCSAAGPGGRALTCKQSSSHCLCRCSTCCWRTVMSSAWMRWASSTSMARSFFKLCSQSASDCCSSCMETHPERALPLSSAGFPTCRLIPARPAGANRRTCRRPGSAGRLGWSGRCGLAAGPGWEPAAAPRPMHPPAARKKKNCIRSLLGPSPASIFTGLLIHLLNP